MKIYQEVDGNVICDLLDIDTESDENRNIRQFLFRDKHHSAYSCSEYKQHSAATQHTLLQPAATLLAMR
jgi:hypothetical protein